MVRRTPGRREEVAPDGGPPEESMSVYPAIGYRGMSNGVHVTRHRTCSSSSA